MPHPYCLALGISKVNARVSVFLDIRRPPIWPLRVVKIAICSCEQVARIRVGENELCERGDMMCEGKDDGYSGNACNISKITHPAGYVNERASPPWSVATRQICPYSHLVAASLIVSPTLALWQFVETEPQVLQRLELGYDEGFEQGVLQVVERRNQVDGMLVLL